MAPQDVTEELREPLLGDSNDGELSAMIEDQTTERNNDDNKNITISLPCCCCKPKKVNHNVLLKLVTAGLYGVSDSLWNGTAYAAYLKKVGRDRNGPLGDIEAVSGIATLVTALPVGYMADRIGRSKVITAGGILLLCTTLVQMGVLQWIGTNEKAAQENATAFWILAALMAFWGIGSGMVGGPVSALYADSTPEGERSIYYNYLFASYTASSMVGPLVSIALFQTLGDEWDLYDLRVVIYVGLGIEGFTSILMCFFDDDKALDESGDEEDEDYNDDGESTQGPYDEDPSAEGEAEAEPLLDDEPQDEEEEQANATMTPLQKRQQWIPYIVFSQGLLFALGSGMTIKFFPLFFKDEVGMSPSQVQIIYCLVPLVMVICSTLASKLASSGFGRVQTTLLFSILGVGCLYVMVFFKSYLDLHPFVLVPIYVVRTSLMNSTFPLQESILMDFVPKNQRATWKSLDAVAAFGWCGSAAVGGWLSDKFDYTYTFLITAIIQSAGVVVWMLLLPLVPRKEGARRFDEEQDDANENSTPTTPQADGLITSD